MELSVMDRINLILSDPEKATMTLAQIVSEEIREFKKSEQYQIILEAESYYRNRSSVQKKTVDVANRSRRGARCADIRCAAGNRPPSVRPRR